jgi:hypothetical protein
LQLFLPLRLLFLLLTFQLFLLLGSPRLSGIQKGLLQPGECARVGLLPLLRQLQPGALVEVVVAAAIPLPKLRRLGDLLAESLSRRAKLGVSCRVRVPVG